MFKLIRTVTLYKLLPVTWTLITIILLCLPGSVLPQEQTFTIPNFDKFVHMTLFGGINLLWGFHYIQKERFSTQWNRIIALAGIFSLALGIALEYVQLYFIPNRDFDPWDILADTCGVVLALIISWLYIRKRS